MFKYTSVSLILRARYNSSSSDIRRYENRGYSHTKTIEPKRHSSPGGRCLCGVTIAAHARGRRHMIVQSAMFVIDNEKCSIFPDWTGSNRVVNHGDKTLACLNVVIRVLI